MKNGKLAALLNTPAMLVIAVGLLILLGEFLIMAVIEGVITPFITHGLWHFIDPILLIAIVSPALYILVFRPISKQQASLEVLRKKIDQAHQEWMAAMDAVSDSVFLHDQQFRILRCNKAYQQCAGLPFHEIIGQPYYTIFPKNHAPLPSCQRAMEKAAAEEEEEEELAAGGAIYRSRAFSIHDEQGAYLYSMHTLEDVTENRRVGAALHDSEEKFRKITGSAQDAIIMMGEDKRIMFWNAAAERMFGYTAAEALGQEMHALITPPAAQAAFARGFQHFCESGEGAVIGKLVKATALRKGGEEFSAELSISATHLDGQWHAIGIVRDITERKQAEAQVAEQMEELRAWHDITLGREMRILELKHEVDELLGASGQPPRYPSAESDDQQEK